MFTYNNAKDNDGWADGWDVQKFCVQFPIDCKNRINAELNYNGYYSTHIFISICLWILCKLDFFKWFKQGLPFLH